MGPCEERNCGYYWKDEDEPFARCHWEDDGFPAPCEEENDLFEDDDERDSWMDDEPDDIDDDMGFDPYEGCFTWDC